MNVLVCLVLGALLRLISELTGHGMDVGSITLFMKRLRDETPSLEHFGRLGLLKGFLSQDFGRMDNRVVFSQRDVTLVFSCGSGSVQLAKAESSSVISCSKKGSVVRL